MNNLTLKNFANTGLNEEDDYSFDFTCSSGNVCTISYFKYRNNTRLTMVRIYGKTHEDKKECLKAFCKEMFEGGILIIDINIDESHFDEYDLYYNGFVIIGGGYSFFLAFNPNVRGLVEEGAANEEEKGKMLERISAYEKSLQKTVNEQARILYTLNENINGNSEIQFKANTIEEMKAHALIIEQYLEEMKLNYGLEPQIDTNMNPIIM